MHRTEISCHGKTVRDYQGGSALKKNQGGFNLAVQHGQGENTLNGLETLREQKRSPWKEVPFAY